MRGTSRDNAKVRLCRKIAFIFRAMVLHENVFNKIINHWEVSKDIYKGKELFLL